MALRSIPSLPLLRAFDAVAHHDTLTAAAAALHRSQPALTIAVAKLERRLSVSLMERGRYGVRLTPPGQLLGRRTRRMLERLDAALDRLDGAAATNRMSDAQLRCFAALADHATVERAAEALSIAPASLRRTAQSLERALGHTLLQHVAHGIGLTRTGAELARHAKLATHEIEAGIEEIEIASGRIQSRIAIGVVPLSATRLLTDTINRFLAAYPGASVSIAHGPYDPLLEDLRSARLDMLYGVLRLPPGVIDVAEESLFVDTYVIAVRNGHPLTRRARLQIEDLTRYDWIAPKSGTPRRHNLQRMFASFGYDPKIAIETSSLELLRSLLATSDRMTLLTRQEMEARSTRGTLVKLEFTPEVSRGHDGIATRKDWQPTPVQQAFLDMLRQRCAEHLHVGENRDQRGAISPRQRKATPNPKRGAPRHPPASAR